MSASLDSLMREPMPRVRESSGLMAFLLIGGGAALGFVLVSSLAMALLPFAPSWVVSALCYAGFIVPVYLLHRRYSFRSQAAHRQALPRYMAVQASALLLAAAFSYLLHDRLGLPSLPAGLLVIVLTSGSNYVLLRSWAFATRQHGRAHGASGALSGAAGLGFRAAATFRRPARTRGSA